MPLQLAYGDELSQAALTAPPQIGTINAVTALSTDAASSAPDAPRGFEDDRVSGVLLLDVSEVSFVDSNGTGSIDGVLKRVMAHRAGLSVAGASTHLALMLRLKGLGEALMLHPTDAAAVRDAVGSPSPPR